MALKRTREKHVWMRVPSGALVVRVRLCTGKWAWETAGAMTVAEAARFRLMRQHDEDMLRTGQVSGAEIKAREEARRPIDDLIADYTLHMAQNGVTTTHRKNTKASLTRWARACSVSCLEDAAPGPLIRWLSEIGQGESGVSARTRNAHRTAVLAMCRWAADYGRIGANPIPPKLVPRANEDAGRVRLSRAMTPEEFRRLLDAAPPVRRAYYLVMGMTGLRRQETARLLWRDIDFTHGLILAPASITKNRKAAEVPMPEIVAKAILAFAPERGPAKERVFATEATLTTWKRDLRRAGLIGKEDERYIDERGRRIDMKCLRMSFGTWLQQAGVDLRDASVLMRHSDINLTAKVYTDVRLCRMHKASEALCATPALQEGRDSCPSVSTTVHKAG